MVRLSRLAFFKNIFPQALRTKAGLFCPSLSILIGNLNRKGLCPQMPGELRDLRTFFRKSANCILVQHIDEVDGFPFLGEVADAGPRTTHSVHCIPKRPSTTLASVQARIICLSKARCTIATCCFRALPRGCYERKVGEK